MAPAPWRAGQGASTWHRRGPAAGRANAGDLLVARALRCKAHQSCPRHSLRAVTNPPSIVELSLLALAIEEDGEQRWPKVSCGHASLGALVVGTIHELQESRHANLPTLLRIRLWQRQVTAGSRPSELPTCGWVLDARLADSGVFSTGADFCHSQFLACSIACGAVV